ncbi:Lsr2 family protein [Streptomyces sp. NPDC006283]|uniref:histone-like nucleoid-structuring protein Lsr2 n=1 Tax=Streptomyces sp. NPDC006283 TaxID=3156741 RepID=UPI0033AEE0DD
MAQRRVTIFIDDVTGEETHEGQTHTFTLNGVEYEIDLSPDSYDQMLEAFGPYLKAGRKVGRRGRKGRVAPSRIEGPSTPEIREWAKEQGIEVSERGRVSSKIRALYEAAR